MIWKRLRSPRIGACRPLRPSRQPRSRSFRTAARCCTRHFRRRTRSLSRAPFWPLATGSTEPPTVSSIIWRHAKPSSILQLLCSGYRSAAAMHRRQDGHVSQSRAGRRRQEDQPGPQRRPGPADQGARRKQRSTTMPTIRSTAMPMTAASWRQPAFHRAKSVRPRRRPATSCWPRSNPIHLAVAGKSRRRPAAFRLRQGYRQSEQEYPLWSASRIDRSREVQESRRQDHLVPRRERSRTPVQGTNRLLRRPDGAERRAGRDRDIRPAVPGPQYGPLPGRAGDRPVRYAHSVGRVGGARHGAGPDHRFGHTLCLAPGHPQPAAMPLSAGKPAMSVPRAATLAPQPNYACVASPNR